MGGDALGRCGAAGRPRKWRRYRGALFYAGVQAAGFGLAKLVGLAGGLGARPQIGQQRLLQPPAPARLRAAGVTVPASLTLDNAPCMRGPLRVLNMPEGGPGRERLVKLQAGAWAVFVAFNAVYFGQRSPVGGALLTVADLALTIETVRVALEEREDMGAALK